MQSIVLTKHGKVAGVENYIAEHAELNRDCTMRLLYNENIY